MSHLAFGLQTPHDLLAKLHREIGRFGEAISHDSPEHRHQSDLAFNCAVTAWHLLDWIWHFRLKDYEIAGKLPGHFSFNDFHSMVRDECEALNVCHEIATGAKHVVLTQKAKPVVEAATKSVLHDSGVLRSVLQPVLRPVMRPVIGRYEETLIVRLKGGRHVPAEEVFASAAEYWDTFLHGRSGGA